MGTKPDLSPSNFSLLPRSTHEEAPSIYSYRIAFSWISQESTLRCQMHIKDREWVLLELGTPRLSCPKACLEVTTCSSFITVVFLVDPRTLKNLLITRFGPRAPIGSRRCVGLLGINFGFDCSPRSLGLCVVRISWLLTLMYLFVCLRISFRMVIEFGDCTFLMFLLLIRSTN